MKKGVLLINLGSPDSADIKAVRRYLYTFLSDKYVIDLPALFRYGLLYTYILPFRAKKTTKAYQDIWTLKGSPLITHSYDLQAKLQNLLSEEFNVALGMRYGNPSIEDALFCLRDCKSITVLPLYPQFSLAATGSAIAAVSHCLAVKKNPPKTNIIRDFYQDPGFINAQAALIAPYINTHDFLLFSYHGLPVRALKCTRCCNGDLCLPFKDDKINCYRAQCYATTEKLAIKLKLVEDKYATGFQSRFGATTWIQPYTENLLTQLAALKIKSLAVVCPSFVTDCLETLEEIGIRAKKRWYSLGGEKLTLIPCVNASELWVRAIAKLVHP